MFITQRFFPQNVQWAQMDGKTRCCTLSDIRAVDLSRDYRARITGGGYFLFIFPFFFNKTHFIVEIGKNCGRRATTLKRVLIGFSGAPYVPRTKWVTRTTCPDPQS